MPRSNFPMFTLSNVLTAGWGCDTYNAYETTVLCSIVVCTITTSNSYATCLVTNGDKLSTMMQLQAINHRTTADSQLSYNHV